MALSIRLSNSRRSLLGDRHHQAALLNTLADLHHAVGHENEAMLRLKQAVALFAEIDEEVGRDQPEIGS